jgi:DNA-binding HxlR family transcriptional regulator
VSVTTAARPCAVADALGVVGEKYAILVLREVFYGVRRFDEIQRNTGAPRDVLTARLRRLVDAGVLVRRQYSERPPRFEYRLTPAGRDLRPVLMTLMDWGEKHLGASYVVFEHSCGADFEPVMTCRVCGKEVQHGELTPHFDAAGWNDDGTRAS